GHQRRTVRPRGIGAGLAHDDDADADDDEGEQGADTGHVTQLGDGQEAGQQRAEDHEDHVAAPGRLELGVNIGEDLGQEAVARHGEEDARLAEQHDQDHAGIAGDDADHDAALQPTGKERNDGGYGSGVALELGVVNHAGEHAGEEDVEHGADGERSDDADG